MVLNHRDWAESERQDARVGQRRALKELDSQGLAQALMERVRAVHPSEVADEFESAARSAAALHAGQSRANRGELERAPYVEHLLRNTIRLMQWGVIDPVMLKASLLHDVVEDSADRIRTMTGQGRGLTERETASAWITSRYGQEASLVVDRVTNPLREPGATREQRNHQYANTCARPPGTCARSS